MTVEDKRVSCEDEANDNFPIGMRVLAVDDDSTCLRVLEGLLRKCQYHVTTTNQAIKALRMLRENRNSFDLIISDVNMPDMDGFKLLELVGLEMDLPVIMLSSHSDTKLVMKGISHGACDYLLKPCRLEELKNIWQHVVRKKKVDPKNKNKSPDQENDCSGENRHGEANAGNGDQNERENKKRKDQDEDDDEDGDEDGQDNDESTQKKPRVVWSVELHRKFVQAVNQLGLDKAVPKKILDLMNVEGLTRENVASHLQKYRLYLKRINTVATQQANMVAAFGSKDSYLRMGPLDGFGDFQTLSGASRFSNNGVSAYQSGSALSRLNAPPPSLALRGISSPGLIQPGHSQSFNNSFNFLGKLQSTVVPANPSNNLFQLNPLAQSRSTTSHGDFNRINDPTNFTIGRSVTSNALLVNPQQSGAQQSGAQQSGTFGNQSSLTVASLNPVSFEAGGVQLARSVDSWQGAGQLARYPSNSPAAFSDPFSHDQLLPSNNNLRDNVSPNGSQIGNNNPIDFSSAVAVSSTLEDSRGATGLIGNVIQNYPIKQTWEGRDFGHNNSFGFANDQTNGSYLSEQAKTGEGFMQNNFDPLDDLMSVMMKREPANVMQQQNEGLLMDGELGFDAYSLGSCM